jgi:hypothetical protein
MAANEISERLRAACWVQCGSQDDGEAVAVFDVDQLRFRSLVGFVQRIVTTVNASQVPVIVLQLDDVCSRRECAVYAYRHGTVGPLNTSRRSYPQFVSAEPGYANVFAQPCHMDWFGPDLEAPLWYPFGLTPGPQEVPAGFNLDLFNAIAIMLPTLDEVAESGDFSVLVLKHPPPEGETEVLQLLPIA